MPLYSFIALLESPFYSLLEITYSVVNAHIVVPISLDPSAVEVAPSPGIVGVLVDMDYPIAVEVAPSLAQNDIGVPGSCSSGVRNYHGPSLFFFVVELAKLPAALVGPVMDPAAHISFLKIVGTMFIDYACTVVFSENVSTNSIRCWRFPRSGF